MSVGLMLLFEMDATLLRREQEKELLFVGRQFRHAIERYHAELSPAGSHVYPERLEDLLLDARGLLAKRHLRKVFVDPMTGKTEWGLIRFGGRIVGVHSLSDKAPIKQEGFEPEDVAFENKARYREWRFVVSAETKAL
jgi:hypothetical protein